MTIVTKTILISLGISVIAFAASFLLIPIVFRVASRQPGEVPGVDIYVFIKRVALPIAVSAFVICAAFLLNRLR